MKCKVISPFADRYNTDVKYAVGDIVDWDDQERIKDCTDRGLIKAVPEKAKPKTTRKPKTTAK